ncbi:MAG: hypothetical protein QM711_16035 [Micropruina sp.]|uniref:hypothetical protein n=1 Tax=Micropruina sp. TaxID=2737536 RepID=UPI0039E6311E
MARAPRLPQGAPSDQCPDDQGPDDQGPDDPVRPSVEDAEPAREMTSDPERSEAAEPEAPRRPDVI